MFEHVANGGLPLQVVQGEAGGGGELGHKAGHTLGGEGRLGRLGGLEAVRGGVKGGRGKM